jgi:hypothetical protein
MLPQPPKLAISKRVRKLERLLGRKTIEVEIIKDAPKKGKRMGCRHNTDA